MEVEIKIKMKVEGTKISVSNSLPCDANVQCILNSLEETHRILFGMLKKVKKQDRPDITVAELYEQQEITRTTKK